MSGTPPARGARVAAGALVFGTAACVSYALQRLGAVADDPALVFAQAHIPYFGRIAMAAIHGGMAGVVVAGVATDPARVVRTAAWWAPALVLPAAGAMVAYP